MLHIDIDIHEGIAGLAKTYGDYLIANGINVEKWAANEFCRKSNSDSLQWDNPESIESGVSGIILLLIELYGQSPRKEYADLLERSIADLLTYCNSHPSTNYSLYTGRAGVAYVLINYYSLTGNERWLKEAVNIMVPVNADYFQSKYTSDYLYDGRAGTLLVILQLYQLTHDKFLLDSIEQLAVRIIRNAHVNEGCCWIAEEELYLKPSCGFARGTAGINYVFKRVGRFTNSPVVDLMLSEINRYTDTCWVSLYGNWGNFNKDIYNEKTLQSYCELYEKNDLTIFNPVNDHGWANGTAGILLSGLEENTSNKYNIDRFSEQVGKSAFPSKNLYDGLSGAALFLVTEYESAGEPGLPEIVYRIAEELLRDLSGVDLQGGLLHGKPGWVYFLLKVARYQNQTESVLSPFLHRDPLQKEMPVTLHVQLFEIKKSWIAKHFPRTIHFLEKADPGFEAHMPEPATNEKASNIISQFSLFVEKQFAAQKMNPVNMCLLDLFRLEKDKLDFLKMEKRSSFQIYLDEWQHWKKVTTCLNQSTDWLLEQRLSVSPSIKKLSSRWNWSFKNDFNLVNDEQIKNTKTLPAQYAYLIQTSGNLHYREYFLRVDRALVLQCFNEPKQVKQAVREINLFIQALPPERVTELLTMLSESQDVADFMSHLNNLMLYEIRQLICRKTLVLN